MLSENKLKRLNEIASKAKDVGLTDDEVAEREVLRKEYLKNFRKVFREKLENIEIVDSE